MFPWQVSSTFEDRSRLFAIYRNYLFLIPLFAIVFFYQATYIAVAARNFQPGHIKRTRPFATRGRLVTGVDTRVASAGLRPGDEILSINDVNFKGDRVLFEQVANAQDGRPFVVLARRGSERPRRIVLPPSSYQSGPASIAQITSEALLSLMLLGCILVGVYVAAVRPYDLRAIVVFCLMVSISQVISLVTWYQFPRALWVFILMFRTVAQATWGLWLILFALYFPERFKWDVRRPFLKWFLLAPAIAWSILLAVGSMASYWSFRSFQALQMLPDQDERRFLTFCITFFFGALALRSAAAPMRTQNDVYAC